MIKKFLTVGFLIFCGFSAQAQNAGQSPVAPSPENSCYFWAKVAEDHYGMPRGLMAAIINTESKGNPYTLNVDGDALYYKSAEETAAAIMKLAPKSYEIDVGCSQLNIRWHGQKFKSLGAMLDPRVNLSYAAWHLTSLKDRFGSWTMAAARYHSFQTERSRQYACKVWIIMKDNAGDTGSMDNPCRGLPSDRQASR